MRTLALLAVTAPFGCGNADTDMQAIADAHVHFKWSQAEVIDAEGAIATLRRQNVATAVVIGTPAEYALRLAALDPERIVAIYGPYKARRNWAQWMGDPELLVDARSALESGAYHGIGELHLIGGFSPRKARRVVIDGVLDLGAEFNVPVMLHTEFSRPGLFLELCRRHPDTRILWTHAGALLPPKRVREVLESCPNVWADLAARDPWRFVNNPVADAETGRLLPDWEQLILDYPERWLIGSDNVWPVDQLDRWDEPDTGWQELGRFLGFHRRWLGFLPKDIARKVGLENARKLFARHAE
ncbi:MAG: amidohydrolase family protein [Gammaproteobacteria bacterium]|nr:amidohydrolase family protein [Gammaproteobacteria bacterium]MCP5137691.1 amidohydrolase family protein [Gammaproteobacteria bacterium]